MDMLLDLSANTNEAILMLLLTVPFVALVVLAVAMELWSAFRG